jgi:hypothetical protein
MKKFINSFIFIVCFLTTLGTSASQPLSGVWVLDTHRTLESLKLKNSEFLEGAQNCFKDQLCFGTLFYFNNDSIYTFHPDNIDSESINYIIFGPYKYNIYTKNNNLEIHYDNNGVSHKLEFELQSEHLILKQNNYNEFYKLASSRKVEEVLTRLKIKKVNK